MSFLNKKLKFMRLAKKISRRLLPVLKLSTNKQVYLHDRVQQYESLWAEIAKISNADFQKLDAELWQLQRGTKVVRVRLHQFPVDNDVVLRICGNKPLVHKLLSDNDIPVPEFILYNLSDVQKALMFQKKHPVGCVAKPCDGYAGLGVTTHITDGDAFQKASVVASLYDNSLMAEKQIVGENYRILIYKGKMLHAVRRTGQRIIGDGVSSIAKLLNINPQVNLNSLDKDLIFTLTAQGYSLETTPLKNSSILVRSVGGGFNGGDELRTVYDQEVTEQVDASIQQDAERCAEIVQADLIGVDIITTDISKNLRETGGIINEINTTPGLHHHYDVNKEIYPRFALTIMEDLLS